MKKYKILILIFIAISVIGFIVLLNVNDGYILHRILRNINNENETEDDLFSFVVYDNQDEDNIRMLANVKSDKGIEYIEEPNNNKLYCYGKNEVAFDYIMKKDDEGTFKIKEVNSEEIEKNVNMTDETIQQVTVGIDLTKNQEGYKILQFDKRIDTIDGFEVYYKIGENGEWKKGNKTSMVDYDVTQDELINDDNTITVYARVKKDEKNIVTTSKKFAVDVNSTTGEYSSESLLKAVEDYNYGEGIYNVTVEDQIYNLKVYEFENDLDITIDTEFGAQEDFAKTDRYAQNMIVLKVNGNLTVEEGATLTANANKNGYGGPKGMLIYCTGTITNNGTISMTGRGAWAEGQDVYLWKNQEFETDENKYELVPAEGAAGAETNSRREESFETNWRAGYAGKNATGRRTGGGRRRSYSCLGFWMLGNCWNRKHRNIIFWRNWIRCFKEWSLVYYI